MSVTSPNMNLVISTVSVDSGLMWEQNLNASLTVIDGHNHTSGSGVQIPSAGININAALSFNNFSAAALQATTFQQQSSLSTLNSLFVGTDGNLYFNDGAGDPSIKITFGGAVNVTSSGIVGAGGASAAFVSGTLTVQSAVNTPGNISGGSLLLGNIVAASNFLTLAPPSSMASSYTLTLIPQASLSTGTIVTVNSSGNMGTTTPDAIGSSMTSIGADAIAISMGATGANSIGTEMTATGANAVANTRTRATGSTVAVGGVAVSTVTSYSNSTGTFTAITTVTITTSGRPVVVRLAPANSNTVSSIQINSVLGNTLAFFKLLSGATTVGEMQIGADTAASLPTQTLSTTTGPITTTSVGTVSSSITFFEPSPSDVSFIDFPAAGTYTYSLQAAIGFNTTSVTAANVSLIAYEL